MKRTSLCIAVILLTLAVAVSGCTTPATTMETTTSIPLDSTVSPSATTATTATTTTSTTTSGSHAPGSRSAVAPATLGGCTPGSGYQGYTTLPLDSTHYAYNTQLTGYAVTIVWRDYQTAGFTPKIALWVIDTVYDINVLKQQMGSKGGFWGVSVDDASNYAAARGSHGYSGWEYRNKVTGEAWVGVDLGNGIYLYAFSKPANDLTIGLDTLRSFVDGLNLGCWAALAPA